MVMIRGARLKHFLIRSAAISAALLFSSASFAAPKYTWYNTNNSGISYNAHHDIIEDSDGFIWTASSYGVNRFDGLNFTSFYSEDIGLPTNYITSLYEDARGDIWIGTDTGASIYIHDSGTFRPLTQLAANTGKALSGKVRYILERSDGIICLAVNGQGLFTYDVATDELRQHFVDEDGEPVLPYNISCFLFDSSDHCIISLYYGGLWICPSDFSSSPLIYSPSENLSYFNGDNLYDMVWDSQGRIYASSALHGIIEIMPRLSSVRELIPNDGFHPYKIALSSEGVIYASTLQGLYIYNSHTHEYWKEMLSADNRLISIASDRKGRVWIGSEFGGLACRNDSPAHFNSYSVMQSGDSLDGALVWGFAEDRQGRIWVATDSKGLLCLDRNSGILSKVRIPGLPDCICGILHYNGELFMCSIKGIVSIDLSTNRMHIYTPRETGITSLVDRGFAAICDTPDGHILFGHTLGVLDFNTATREFSSLEPLSGMNITAITPTTEGEVWMSTSAHGIIHYDYVENHIMDHYYMESVDENHVLPYNKINDITSDRSGNIWAASFGMGCFVISPNGKVTVLDKNACSGKIGSDVICSVSCDFDDNIWLATSSGLSRVSPDMRTINPYSFSDGLLSSSFNHHSSFRSSDGVIWMGMYDGFVSMNLESLSSKGEQPHLIVSSLEVNGEKIIPGDGSGILKTRIDASEIIRLNHRQNNFSFQFSLPGLASPSGYYVTCQLEGYDKHPVQAGDNLVASWNNVSPGRYRLKMQASSTDGAVDSSHPLMTVIVRAHPMRSVIAIILYILCLAVLIRQLIVYVTGRRLEEERRHLEEMIASTPERRLLRAAEMGQEIFPLLSEHLSATEIDFMKKVDSLIDASMKIDSFSSQDLADSLHIGIQTLNRRMKKLVGVTANDYIKLIRLSESVRLLHDKAVRVNEICYAVGFNTPSYFAKCFKSCYGFLPQEYRKEISD